MGRRTAVADWLARYGLRSLVARRRAPSEDALSRFVTQAQAAACEVRVLPSAQDVTAAVNEALDTWNLTRELVVTPDPLLRRLFQDAARFVCRFSGASAADLVGVALPLAGVAETGTLVFETASESPTTVAFLPDCLIAVVPRSRLVASYEEAVERVLSGQIGHKLPARVHFVTGPSRTADIEEALLLGAHGPRKVLILVLDGC